MVAAFAALLMACGAAPADDAATGTQEDEARTEPAAPWDPKTSSATVDGGSAPDPIAKAPPSGSVTPAAILAKLMACANKVSTAPYMSDVGGTANVDVCALQGAVFWKADMDIDCDGKSSALCNKTADPAYQSQTAATDSMGAPLDAANLPYIVVPGVSSRWSYNTSGVALGSVAAVIYNGKIQYGIVGDLGPTSIIGEASYAMAKDLGINPDPKSGGTASGVVYVVFTGPSGIVKKKEDHAEAVKLATARALQFLAQN